MDCELIRAALVAYHFGSVEEAARDRIEAHLLACPDCLKAFLALKREIETAEAGPRPSEEARRRLRLAVARELAARSPERTGAAAAAAAAAVGAWWRRPLAFGFAAAACAAALIAVVSVRGQLHHIAGLTAGNAAASSQYPGAPRIK